MFGFKKLLSNPSKARRAAGPADADPDRRGSISSTATR